MSKRATAIRIKSELTYTIAEAAEETHVSPATVRQWIRDGLPAMRTQKPFLIVGADLKSFLKTRNAKRKTKLGPNEFRCMTCKRPRRALGGLADFECSTPQTGSLTALCDVCERPVHRFISTAQLDDFRRVLEIAERAPSTPRR